MEDLTERQYNRLLDLIKTGRKFHLLNFVFAGLMITILLKDSRDQIKLFLNLEFEVSYFVIFLYVAILIYTFLSFNKFNSIWLIIKDKDFEVDFNWFIFSRKRIRWLSVLYLSLPYIISNIAFGFSGHDSLKGSLLWGGLFFISYPVILNKYAYQIRNKCDEDGKKVTVSIYLLYWYRIFRSFWVLISIIIVLPKYLFDIPFEKTLIQYSILTGIVILMWVLRILWPYKKIDPLGIKFGFAETFQKDNSG